MIHPLAGKWRFVELDLWGNRESVDQRELAHIRFDEQHGGEFSFGDVTGKFDCSYAKTKIYFLWDGREEMGEVSGEGWAELKDDGSVTGEIHFDDGEDASFIAEKWDSLKTSGTHYDRQLIEEQAERNAPCPKIEPSAAGMNGFAIAVFALTIFFGIAGIDAEGRVFWAILVVLFGGIFGPYIYFNNQRRRHSREWMRLDSIARERDARIAVKSDDPT